MRPRIVFGVFSATQSGESVNQLAESLHPHRVLVHHDFGKRSDFHLTASNATLVPDPVDTGWGTWGFSESIFHTLKYAVDHLDFDYFQIMSPTCLPIRPVRDLEERILEGNHDVHADMIQIERDDDTLMSFGYRTYVPGSTLRMRLLRRARQIYFGADSELIQTASVTTFARPEGSMSSLRSSLALLLTRLAAAGWLARHPFGHRFKPMIGSIWIGMTRGAAEYLVAMSEDPRVGAYLKHLPLVDEILFPSLLANSGYRIGPSNHAVNDFTREGSPRWITDADFDILVATGRYFARKFRDEPDAELRRKALRLSIGELEPI